MGYNYTRDQHDLNWQLSGGVVGHSDGITFSQPLGDTNVLIKAPGASGVSVENQTGVKTDWRGYAVMPYATVYRYNRVALDTNTMSNNTDIENNVSSVVPTNGALVRASFDTRIGVRALLTVKRDNQPVPFGAVVRETQSGVTSMVGDDGQIYLSGLPLSGELLIQWGDGKQSQCRAPYSLPEQSLQQAITLKGSAVNKIHYLGLSLLAFLPLSEAFATVCVNENGVPTEVYYDLTDKFNSSNNRVGQIVTLSEKSQWVGVNAVCPKGTSGNTTKRSYVTEFPVTGTSDGYQYLKLNDYLDGAMKITDSYAGTFYPPRKYIQMGSHPNVSKNKPFGVQDSSLVFRLKVTRRFINMVVIPGQSCSGFTSPRPPRIRSPRRFIPSATAGPFRCLRAVRLMPEMWWSSISETSAPLCSVKRASEISRKGSQRKAKPSA